MNIGIQTWGSNGDIRPFIAFGSELVKRGHLVTISILSVDGKDYSEICKNNGINYIKLPLNNIDNLKDIIDKIGTKSSSLKMINILLKKLLFPFVGEIYEICNNMAINNDVLVGHLLMYPLKVAALKNKKPYISVIFWPGFLKSDYSTPYPLKSSSIILNRLLWKIADCIFNFLLKNKINELYKIKLNIKINSAINEGCLSNELNIIPASKCLWNEYSDWKNSKIIGSWEIDIKNESEYEFNDKIEEFIRNKKKNVFISLGSAQQINSIEIMDFIVSVAKKLNANVFVQTSEEKYKKDFIDGNIYFFDAIPHGIILKYCNAAVHHGGAGTTQIVLKYGIPSVVLGFTGEQMSWGEQIYKLGVGLKPLNYKKTTQIEVIKAITKLLENREYFEKSKLFSEKIKNENGINAGCELIETFLV